jgi:type I restriction enzyme S subunit
MSQTQRLISDHINIWTSAEAEKKSGRGRSSNNAGNIFGIQKMRELILELAVQGRLTSNNLNEKPSIEELMEIQKEIPFKLHKNWRWTSLPDIAKYKVGKTPSTKNSSYWTGSNNGYNWVSIADLIHGGTISKTSKKVTDLAQKEVFKSIPIEAGTILMSFKLTIGKISILEVPAYHNEAIISIYPSKFVNKDFLFKILPSRAKAGISKSAIKGNTLNSKSLAKLLIPLPPLPEQIRIVSKVNDLMAICNQLEQQHINSSETHEKLVQVLLHSLAQSKNTQEFKDCWKKIASHFEVLFTTEESVDELIKTIIQLAVMGKLVPQDPKDEPASELIKKIEIEKSAIKNIKNTFSFNKDNISFNLPQGWKWVKFSDIAQHNSGKTLDSSRNTGEYRNYITTSNLYWGSFDLSSIRKMPIEDYELERCTAKKGDLLIIEGGEAGRAAVWESDNDICFQNHIHRARFYGKINPYYAYRYFEKLNITGEINQYRKGIGISSMSGKSLGSIPFPLPPLDEQSRIVNKLDQLMALCDELKSRIQQASMQQKQIADVLVSQALN